MKILGVIPARYESTRFPGKVLATIGDKSMIQRVYLQATQAQLLDKVVVATESGKVLEHVESFGGNCCLTGDHHVSGTDRCYEALTLQNETYDYVVNIQGDEPFLAPAQIDEVAVLLDGSVELATLVKQISNQEELFSHGEVKTVFDNKMNALYFSRQPIPFVRSLPENEWLEHQPYYKHIGIYAYRVDVLKQIANMPPSPLELAESLEQLRWLENDLAIKLALTHYESVCIDTPEDLERVLNNLSEYEP